MHHNTLRYFYLKMMLSGIVLSLFACGGDSGKDSNDLWKDTQVIQLRNENLSLKIPNSFKRSSRYRIKEDLPGIGRDSFLLLMMQNTLENLEFQDAEIDVFIDTITPGRLLIILNTELIPFDKTSGQIIHTAFKRQFESLERDNEGLSAEKVDSKMNNNSKQKMLKFKYKISNAIIGTKIFQAVYFVSTRIQTLVVYEFSSEEQDIEKYLWSLKE